MTLKEWTAFIIAELKDEGFEAANYQGFPLVKRPATMEATVRLLKIKLSYATQRTIYEEGMLFTPYGIDPEKDRPQDPPVSHQVTPPGRRTT